MNRQDSLCGQYDYNDNSEVNVASYQVASYSSNESLTSCIHLCLWLGEKVVRFDVQCYHIFRSSAHSERINFLK
jgi:hypothetical protein